MTEWMPIESAPRDGSNVLLFVHDPYDETETAIVASFWEPDALAAIDDHEEMVDNGPGAWLHFPAFGNHAVAGIATHWMPLPAPPSA